MIYASGITFAMIVVLTIGYKFATQKTEKAIEIYKFFLYSLIGVWFGVTTSMIYVTYFTTIEITVIQKGQNLPAQENNENRLFI